MRSFAADVRINNEDMPKFMRALADSELEAMAHYLSAL
jgi:mono/diheme cytochrome c family protein